MALPCFFAAGPRTRMVPASGPLNAPLATGMAMAPWLAVAAVPAVVPEIAVEYTRTGAVTTAAVVEMAAVPVEGPPTAYTALPCESAAMDRMAPRDCG